MASLGFKRAIAAGAAAIVLGGAAIGFVSAAEPAPGATPNGPRHSFNREDMQKRHEQFITTLAGKLGVSVDKLKQAMADTHKELGGPGGPGGGHRGGMWFDLEAAAKAMNITRDQLRTELAGKTLTAVAGAHNVSAATVSTAIKNAAIAKIDAAVTANRMTSDQAAKAKSELDQKINEFMNRTFPAAGQRGPGGPQPKP